MTEQEFMELLNLYLDHEISAEDAVRLEAEVQRNPKRRTVYRDYCRMQKACRVLAADFAPQGRETATLPDPKILPFSRAQRAGPGWRLARFGAVGTVAAAGVALIVFFGRSLEDGRDENPRTATPVSWAPAPRASSIASGLPVHATRGSETSVGNHGPLVSSSLVFSLARSGESGLKVAQGGDQLEWVRNFQLVSMGERTRFEPLRFDPAPPTLRPDLRTLQHTQQSEPALESSAFRFLK